MPRHTITIEDPAAFREAVTFARKHDCESQFARGVTLLLSLLSSFPEQAESHGGTLAATIIKDGAPYSFAWWASVQMPDQPEASAKVMMNGGLIYHGPGDHGAGGAPAFSAMLGRDASKTPHEWAIHT